MCGELCVKFYKLRPLSSTWGPSNIFVIEHPLSSIEKIVFTWDNFIILREFDQVHAKFLTELVENR